MKRRNEEQIGQLLQEYLRVQGLEAPLNEHRLLSSWGEVMGEAVNRRTGKLSIRDEVLYVEIKSPTLRSDMLMMRSDIVKKLNAHVGFNVIRDVRFI
ncbi:MAG: DUF721 domain-containing protein [Bacteroidaceae bacterium]|nr:DUF721 domain-containing protein [Bacteroidaceae bacterium]